MTAPEAEPARRSAALIPYVPRVVIEWLRTAPRATQRELDGTLAFVDLSGFTAMSERLAGRGKAGAEELTDVINRTFSSLLDVAYENGGGLLKMGGDALLLFFSGEEHCPRAARAAFGMRQTLREVGRPRTSAGAVTLRMHVGLHTGAFQFFLVGDSHRELLLAGPAVTETVAMEAGADAGDILLSQAAAAALPHDAIGAEKAGGRLLRRSVPVSTARLEPLPDVAGLPLELCVPVAIRDYVGGDPIEPEHRQATVAFVQFAGSDRLLAEHGAPALAKALEELVRAVQTSAEEHRVSFLETDIDADGGRLVLVAGAPSSAGDDDERMLRAVRAIVDAKVGLPIQIGVNRGRVFAGEVGAPFRRTYTILGDTAALAARLMARAQQGSILAAQEVVERAQFETTELEPFRVKGKKAPVVAHEVGAVTGERSVAQPAVTAFVGRERELTVLGASLAPVRMGFGSLVELIGDPGMGKSRLIDELQRQNPDLEYVSTSCEEYEQSTPYFPFRALLGVLLDQPLNGNASKSTALLRERLAPLAPELVPWIPLLALPLDLELESTPEVDELQPAFRRARLHGVVETLLEKLLPTPTLLAIEDVHWMDEASSDLLRHLGSRVSSKPSMICATRRPGSGGFVAAEGVPPVAALTIHLEPLGVEAAEALIDAAGANGGMHPDEVAAITERAGGNPLFLQELAASEQHDVDVELPENVEAVIVARVDKLAPADRTRLRFASVLGSSFSGELVGRVLAQEDPSASAESDTWDRLNEFVERDPYTPGTFRFRHVLFRDAAYEGLSYRRRRELHAAVGDAFEVLHPDDLDEHAEVLSLHFFHAQHHQKAYRYSLLAGRRAQAKYANVEAAGFYKRALEAGRRLPTLDAGEVAKVWEALGDVCELSARYTEAGQAYAKARRLAGEDGADLPSLLHKEGVVRERSSRYPQALRWYRRALAAAERLEPDGEQSRITREIRLAYAGVRLRQGEFKDCIKWSRSVVEQALAADDMPALAHAYHLLHLAYTSLGSPERVALRGLALPIYEEVGDLLGQANVLNNLGIDAYYEGRWDDALDIYGRSRDLRDRVGDVVGAATAANNIGEIKSDQGHYEEAASLFNEAYTTTSSAGALFLANLARSNLGRLAARQGDTGEAETLLRDALAGFEEIKARSFVVETNARLVELAVLTERGGDAVLQADETLAAVKEAGGGAGLVAMLHRLRGYGLMQTGDLDAAGAALDDSVQSARESGESYELALSLEARARLASLRSATDPESERESSAIFERLGVVWRPEIPLPGGYTLYSK